MNLDMFSAYILFCENLLKVHVRSYVHISYGTTENGITSGLFIW